MKQRLVAALMVPSSVPTAQAVDQIYSDTQLYSGANGPPPGWADGYTYSIRSASECKRLMSRVPLDARDRNLLSCITRDKRPQAPTS